MDRYTIPKTMKEDPPKWVFILFYITGLPS